MEYDGGATAPSPARYDGARHVWPGQPGYETASVVNVPAPEVTPPAAEDDDKAPEAEEAHTEE